MTVGQRIAQKRRELGLSQEGLGEKLGVSRQAIYKWESDAALPEIEKLVNLSREFGVSVGWLLGEEDNFPERPELTAEQLRMVEEIVGRYLDARPPEHTVILPETAGPEEGGGEAPPDPEGESKTGPAGVRWLKRWGLAWAALAALTVVAMVFFNLFDRLNSVRQDYQILQNSVSNIREDVNRQINGIAGRVEEVLQSQNALTAEQSAQVVETDCRANTVTIEARAVPRTYVEGMTAEFTVVSGGESFTTPGKLGENHAFTARITVPLTDEITVSAVFLNGDQRQTQVLEEFTGLYSGSFAGVELSGGISSAVKTQGDPAWTVTMQTADVYCFDAYGNAPRLSSLRVGLFRDQKLVQWFNKEEEQDGSTGKWRTFRLEEETVQMEIGHSYCIAAVVKDEYGREWVVPGQHGGFYATEDSVGDLNPLLELSRDPADWEY